MNNNFRMVTSKFVVLGKMQLYKDKTNVLPLWKCSVNKLKGTSVTTSMSYLCWDIRCRLMMFHCNLYLLLFDFNHLVYNTVAHPESTLV